MEQEIRALNADLERKVEERTAEALAANAANLLGNAVKFTAAGTVSLSIRQPVAGRLCFLVGDTGIGMTTEQQQQLFQAFTQTDSSTTRNFGGTGLGLVISKRLVELMGGTIEVTSAPSRGSCFSVEIEAPECGAPDSGLVAENPVSVSPEGVGDPDILAGLAGRRILLVDDYAINREIVIGLLKGSGLLIEVAENGQQAVERCQQTPWDLILMDIQMPVMDGLEGTRCIRAFDPWVPIIAVTANAFKNDIDNALSAGMNAHLSKPISRQQLYTMLRTHLKPMPGHTPQEHLPSSTTPSIAPAPTDDFPEITGIDRVRVTQFFEGNRALFLRLLTGFADDYADVARQTAHDLAAGDRLNATMRMHTLRGIAGQMGALDIAASAGALEMAIQQDASALDASMTALDDQVSALIAAIASWRRGTAADSTAAAHVSVLAEALAPLDAVELAGLRDALRAHNLNALTRYEALQPALSAVLGEARSTEIGRAINRLRVNEALSLLEACGDTEDRTTGPGSNA